MNTNAVKAFESENFEELEQEINAFLRKLELNGEVLDSIQYNAVPIAISTHTEYGVYPAIRYTALVLYKRN